MQNELSKALQSLSEKAKSGTEFIQRLKKMEDGVNVSITETINAFSYYSLLHILSFMAHHNYLQFSLKIFIFLHIAICDFYCDYIVVFGFNNYLQFSLKVFIFLHITIFDFILRVIKNIDNILSSSSLMYYLLFFAYYCFYYCCCYYCLVCS